MKGTSGVMASSSARMRSSSSFFLIMHSRSCFISMFFSSLITMCGGTFFSWSWIYFTSSSVLPGAFGASAVE